MNPAPHRPRSLARLLTLALCGALVFAGFVGLGTWQVRRLHWKLDLIARVTQRVHAPPVAAPGPARWPQISARSDEYRHVRLSGILLYDLTTPVQAVTRLGGGFWLLTPLRRADGSIVLVNRGFVPLEAGRQPRQRPTAAASGVTTVTGLLRMTEPGGGFLRHNDPAHNRWYSRDVQAISAARGLSDVAPYFVDADATTAPVDGENAANATNAAARPIGGLTVITFHNNHLVYALTWYALALMTAGACFWVAREEYRSRHRGAGTRAGVIDRVGENGEHH